MRLNQINQLSDTWMELQEKWLYLDRLFFETHIYLRPTQDYIAFEAVINEFRVNFFNIIIQ